MNPLCPECVRAVDLLKRGQALLDTVVAERDSLKALITKQREWIDCNERMPEDGQFIFAYGPNLGEYVDGPNVEVCRWVFDCLWTEGGTELYCHDRGRGFTHWMPLPGNPTC